MLNLFGSIRSFLRPQVVTIDNNVFQLHYRITMAIMIFFSILVSSYQYFGDPINCIEENIPASVMNTYCWITSTFTIPNRSRDVGIAIAFPGVSTFVEGKDEVKHQNYYQWIPLCLSIQAIMFYVPRFIWQTWEGGRMEMLSLNLHDAFVDKTFKEERLRLIVHYLRRSSHRNNFYAYKFFFCELLNFLNVIVQVFAVDFLLGHEFSTYGWNVLNFFLLEPEDRMDPMALVFPKITKCTFNKYGPSGGVQHFDSICILPLNVVNEKIYVFLWFWYILLLGISGLVLMYHALVLCIPPLRYVLIRARSTLSSHQHLRKLCSHFLIGDWFLFYQLGKNMDPFIFKELINDYHQSFLNCPTFDKSLGF